MVIYKFTETGSEQDGISSAVWRELEREIQRREIYERATRRREQEEQKENLRKQFDIMKLLHPLEFSSHNPTEGSRGGFSKGSTHENASVNSTTPFIDPYATGDHRSNAGMNWDATGRLRGSPELTVPQDGCDDWVLAGDAKNCSFTTEKDFCDTTNDTPMSHRKLPAEALAALRVPPPEIHWPQSDAVRHILEEEDEHDAALFALQISHASMDEEALTAERKIVAPIIIGNIETGAQREHYHASDSIQDHHADFIRATNPRATLCPEDPQNRKTVTFTDLGCRTTSAMESLAQNTKTDTSTDTELDRRHGGERNTKAISKKTAAAIENKVLNRIERAVDLGLRIRMLSRVSQIEELANDA
ncbi:unnamed protein product [Notodromas monacha]|uniref:Uncharacterized protein n=1 Tax=Notodromas monacha TaxID=399045 RepID=A0A7R9BP91_9CRUS|nr:unnamed protein product [Notodromas monacha]CAG0919169.1 unnamed protein product [Notodromas monacha]